MNNNAVTKHSKQRYWFDSRQRQVNKKTRLKHISDDVIACHFWFSPLSQSKILTTPIMSTTVKVLLSVVIVVLENFQVELLLCLRGSSIKTGIWKQSNFLCFRFQLLLKLYASEFASASSPLEFFASASDFLLQLWN